MFTDSDVAICRKLYRAAYMGNQTEIVNLFESPNINGGLIMMLSVHHMVGIDADTRLILNNIDRLVKVFDRIFTKHLNNRSNRLIFINSLDSNQTGDLLHENIRYIIILVGNNRNIYNDIGILSAMHCLWSVLYTGVSFIDGRIELYDYSIVEKSKQLCKISSRNNKFHYYCHKIYCICYCQSDFDNNCQSIQHYDNEYIDRKFRDSTGNITLYVDNIYIKTTCIEHVLLFSCAEEFDYKMNVNNLMTIFIINNNGSIIPRSIIED